jgi:hypothetical protein
MNKATLKSIWAVLAGLIFVVIYFNCDRLAIDKNRINEAAI